MSMNRITFGDKLVADAKGETPTFDSINIEGFGDVETEITKNRNGGFIDYNDTGTAISPISLLTEVWTPVTNNGLGAFTNKNTPPFGVTELMDSVGNIDVSELLIGDYILIRNDFTVTPSTNGVALECRYTLGAGAGSYTLDKRLGRLDNGAGVPYRFSLSVDKIYMGDTNTRDNPIGLELKLTGDGTVVNSGTVISVVRYTV